MITCPSGWHIRLLRQEGALAGYLYTTLTGTPFRNKRLVLNPEDLACFPQVRSFRWYRETDNNRRSYKGLEIQAFVQIATAYAAAWINAGLMPHTRDAKLLICNTPFPALGLELGAIRLYFCHPKPSQGKTFFLDDLQEARDAAEAQGKSTRWLIPHTPFLPRGLYFTDWPEADANGFPFLTRPDLEDRFLWLDLTHIREHLLAQKRKQPQSA